MKDAIIQIVTSYVITMLILWVIALLLNFSFSIRTGTAIWLALGLISSYIKN